MLNIIQSIEIQVLISFLISISAKNIKYVKCGSQNIQNLIYL